MLLTSIKNFFLPLNEHVGKVVQQRKTGRLAVINKGYSITWLDTNKTQVDWLFVDGKAEPKVTEGNFLSYKE